MWFAELFPALLTGQNLSAAAVTEAVRDLVQRFIPRDPRELPGTLRAGAAHRMLQPVGMMDPLGVTRDLGADHAGGITLQFRATDPADGRTLDHLDVERAGRGTIMRTGRMPDLNLCV